MSLKRVAVLLGKEFLQGPKNYIFVFAIVAPVIISLVFSLVFGTLFTDKPKLGIVDEGNSQLVTMSQELDSVITKEYSTVSGMKQAVQSGAVDMGIVLPEGFDDAVSRGEKVRIEAYIWGESLLKNRLFLGITMAFLFRDLTGLEAPVEVATAIVGEGQAIPWEERLLPVIVLMTIILGGIMVPATSLVEEKQNRTLGALVITPTSLIDVLFAKGLLDAILSFFVAIVVLVLNGAIGTQPLLLALVLGLGAIMAAASSFWINSSGTGLSWYLRMLRRV